MDRLLRPVLPWQTLMQRFVQRVYGGSRLWNPPSRRHLYRNLWLPGMKGQLLRVLVAVDTGGSTRWLISRFIAEVTLLARTFDRIELTLAECDSRVARVRVFVDPGEISTGELETVRGGGGTDLRPAFEAAARNPPACFIFLTDGDGPVPNSLQLSGVR